MKQKEAGQGLVEYAIILALVAIVVIAVMRLLGPKIGNTFSTINNDLDISSGSQPAESGDDTFSNLTFEAEQADRQSLEDYEAFQEQVFQQGERLDEGEILLTENFDETMEVLSEFAYEMGNQVFYDLIVQVQEEAAAGNYETIMEILSGDTPWITEIPADVWVTIILKTEWLLIDSYYELQDAQVSYESFEAALYEIEALGDSEKVNQMWYLWSLVEDRNTIIGEILPGFAAVACFNADVLVNTGDAGYIELGEQYKAEIGSCP
jgi:pilus assembly protein Flp/PilA